eukprot:SAG22_NODE_86_length_21440_cov_288.248700_11_plen_73_part_00
MFDPDATDVAQLLRTSALEKDYVLATCGHTFARNNVTNWLIGGTSTKVLHPSEAPGTVPQAHLRSMAPEENV